MRGRLTSVGIAFVFAGALVLVACGDGSGDASKNATVSGRTLSTRTVTAGDVTVKITPRRLDARGAVIGVVFDTHARELDFDVAKSARLSVGGIDWPGATYSGDGPGGHHRDGELRFPAGGPIEQTLRVSISGLPQPVAAEWTLEATR